MNNDHLKLITYFTLSFIHTFTLWCIITGKLFFFQLHLLKNVQHRMYSTLWMTGALPIRDIDILRCIVAPPLECLIRFGTRTRVYTQIRTHVRTHRCPRSLSPIAITFADTHVAFCNETVQITAARTAMHVIMNARRLFVSVPSAGNIGHFEFSIFNALVSPFGPLLSWCPPALALSFPAILIAAQLPLSPRPCMYETVPRAIVYYTAGIAIFEGTTWKLVEKVASEINVRHDGISW